MVDVEDRFITGADGLRLHLRLYGVSNGGTPVVCLPGLTRNLLDFDGLAHILAASPHGRQVISISSRGRGRSDRDPDPTRYTVPVEASDVIAVMDALSLNQAAFIGTSRGGLILHMLAMTHPERIDRAVLNDIGPVLEADGLRTIQTQLAARDTPGTIDEAVAALRQAYGAEFPRLTEQDWRDMAGALFREQDGRLSSDYDPAIAAQISAIDLNAPLPTLWEAYEGLAKKPLMVIRGENSQLLSHQTVQAMAARKPDLVFIEAEGQGHAPILHLAPLPEQIAAFLTA
ncbi:alpha/beta fold hydrolase [Rhizobium sp. G187]|uniref:alpha/beta fold hydrolase n=1 Tax=Rhizobium sp. G187 TaxID=3451352 RepID=UPI003EE6E89A